MTKPTRPENIRQSKPVIRVNTIQQLQSQDPNMIYTAVRMDDRLDLTQEYLDNGWEIAYETTKVSHDYDSSKSSSTETNLKPSPIVKEGRGGVQFIYMCKSKEQQKIDNQKRVEEDQKRLEASTGRITKKGRNTRIDGSEISINT